MLVLARRKDEGVTVKTPAGDLRVMVVRVDLGRVYLGFDAPKEWAIERDDMKTTNGGTLPQAASAAIPPSGLSNGLGRS